MPMAAEHDLDAGTAQPTPAAEAYLRVLAELSCAAPRVVPVIRLAEGGAEQVPDAVGEGQAECSADDQPQDGAADAAAAQVSAEGPGQAQSDQDGGQRCAVSAPWPGAAGWPAEVARRRR
jgi:hypothetical protein